MILYLKNDWFCAEMNVSANLQKAPDIYIIFHVKLLISKYLL